MICIAPDCTHTAEATFTAAAEGRLAGRDWRPGDTILLCPHHAMDVYGTIGETDPARVAPWLRPDAADPPNTWRSQVPDGWPITWSMELPE